MKVANYPIYLLMPKFQQKIIEQIKLLSSQELHSVGDFLFLLSSILNQEFRLHEINKYLSDQYPHNKLQWKTIATKQLLQIYQKQTQYIKSNLNRWKQQAEIAKVQMSRLLQQKIKLKKFLRQKTLSKAELIDSYLQQIRRNKVILSKSKQEAEKIKYQQNVDSLQKKIQTMRSPNFQNQQDQLKQESNKSFQLKQNLLNKIAEQFQFKKKFFYQQDIMDQNQSIVQNKLKLQRRINQLIKKINNIYYHYSKQNYNPSETFENNKKNLQTMDLRLFLKYYKDFGFFEKEQPKFQVTNITNLFKKHALNGKHLSLNKFINIHSQLFDLPLKITQIQKSQAKQLLKDEQIKKRKQQIQQKLNKIQYIREIFSSTKIKSVLNIIKTTKKANKQKNDFIYQNLNRIIDKTSKDYSKTREMLHEQMKRNIFQKQHSSKVYKYNKTFNEKNISQYTNSTLKNNFAKNSSLNKDAFQTIVQQADSDFDYRRNPQSKIMKNRNGKNHKSQLSLRTNSEFTLPRLTRLSDQRIQSQSIYKSLEYLYNALGKKQNEKIKKILNYQKNEEVNKIQNDYLKQYFNHEKQLIQQVEKKQHQQRQKKAHRKSCPRYNSSDYKPFMKF